MNESITIDNTSGSDKCAGCPTPAAATWFLKYICGRNASRKRFERDLPQARAQAKEDGIKTKREREACLIIEEGLDEGLSSTSGSTSLALIRPNWVE